MSAPSDVLSGVPRGSVLGPALFLLYINHISEDVNSTMRLFADDSVLYRHINNKADQDILHQDLLKVFEWAERWDMKFNVTKCPHVTITLKHLPLIYSYGVNGQVMPKKQNCKYLGVNISESLSWNAHSEQVRAKAARSLGLIRRTLGKCKVILYADDTLLLFAHQDINVITETFESDLQSASVWFNMNKLHLNVSKTK